MLRALIIGLCLLISTSFVSADEQKSFEDLSKKNDNKGRHEIEKHEKDDFRGMSEFHRHDIDLPSHVSAVDEPSVTVMLMAGLALIGVIAVKRSRRN
jgi:hypothetical protein